jgi:hypothetical protein
LEQELPEPELPQFDDLWDRIQEADEVDEQTELADFLDADQALATSGTRTLEEIAASTSHNNQAEPESEDDEPEALPPPPVSRQQAYQSFDQLRRYVEENIADPKAIQFCHYMEDLLHQEQAKASVQASITQFFK